MRRLDFQSLRLVKAHVRSSVRFYCISNQKPTDFVTVRSFSGKLLCKGVFKEDEKHFQRKPTLSNWVRFRSCGLKRLLILVCIAPKKTQRVFRLVLVWAPQERSCARKTLDHSKPWEAK